MVIALSIVCDAGRHMKRVYGDDNGSKMQSHCKCRKKRKEKKKERDDELMGETRTHPIRGVPSIDLPLQPLARHTKDNYAPFTLSRGVI